MMLIEIVPLLKLGLSYAIYLTNLFVLKVCHCVKLETISYKSVHLDRLVADKSHSVILA